MDISNGVNKNNIVIGVLAVLVVGVVVFLITNTAVAPNPSGSFSDSKLYISPDFKVIVKYPSEWKADLQLNVNEIPIRFEGRDGFFAVDAGDASSLDDVLSKLALHKLNQTGDNKDVTILKVDGQNARMVVPAQTDVDNAALIVEYPKAVTIKGSAYKFLLIYSNKKYIKDFAENVAFFENSTGELSGSPNILVYKPNSNDSVSGTITVAGIARVFESTLAIRIRNANYPANAPSGSAKAEVSVHADAPDAGTYGNFSHKFTANELAPAQLGSDAVIEVFQYSAKDGTEIDKISIPIHYVK